jgi:hypothetical protein
MKLIGGRHMAHPDRALLACLAAAGLVTVALALLAAGAAPTMPPRPLQRPADVSQAAAHAEARERQQRELTYLRNLRTQYRWGIDNLRANQTYLRYQQVQLREERKRMPADDPARETLERRLAELPEMVRQYAENEARAARLLAQVEAELAAREVALGPGGPGL